MLTIGTQKSDRILSNLKSDRTSEIVNSCFDKSVLEVENYFR
jgi:hypothetical protein